MIERRKAAVAFAVIAEPPYGVVFVQRAAHLRDHPGQIGLPGGRLDRVDGDDLQNTALRELHEEVGVAADRVTVIDRLPMLRQRVNTFDVTPFVAVVAPGPFVVDAEETAGMFTVPLDVIVARRVTPSRVTIGELSVESLVLDYEGRRIWGLTAHILRSFLERWDDPDSPLRERLEAALGRAATPE